MAPKRMLIDALHPEETRVAVLDGSRLEDIDVEVASRKQLKGNIYLAKVTRVEPSLQAAFVDYGGNRHGFLAFNEIHPDYYQIPVADREALVAEHDADEAADEAARDEEADVDEPDNGPRGNRKDVEVVGGDDIEEVEARRPSTLRRNYKIQEVIKRRQILLVQVVKEERGNKGAAVTTYLSLAGRYCVLMPNTARGGGISRKIPAGKDRKRLKTILSDLDIPEGMGVIVRTAGAGRSKAEIRRDFDYLLRLWDNVRQLTLESIAPDLVYEEANLIKRSIRDLYNREIEEVVVEGEEGYKIARNFMKLMIPSHVKRVKLFEDGEMPLFHRFQVENQLDAIHSPTVRLKSGGYIVINPTEALVSIDVNSGRSTKERNIEETALRTNIEACDEVARQLRLRDLAGLVVIDFIDMEVSRNRSQVERRLKEAMKVDRARIQIGRISPFGLMELSRQRLRPSFLETSFESCPHCGGVGVRRSTESTALHLLRAIEEEGIKRRSSEAIFHVPSDVALYLLNHKRAALLNIEARYNLKVVLAADDSLVPPDFRVERIQTRQAEDVDEAQTRDSGDESRDRDRGDRDRDNGEQGDGDGSRKRRRRRPRRRKRSDDAEATSVTGAEGSDGEEPESEAAEAESQTEQSAGEEGDSEKPAKRRRRGKRGGRRRRSRSDDEAIAAESTEGEDRTVSEEAPAEQQPADVEPAVTAEAEAAAPSEEPAAATGETPAEEASVEEKKKPRRRRRTRKTEAEATPAEEQAAEPAAEPAEAAAQPEPEPEPEPQPEPVAEQPAPAEPALVEPAQVEPAQAEPAVEHPAPEPVPALADTAEEQKVDPATTIIDVDSDEAKTKRQPRKGWWQRVTE